MATYVYVAAQDDNKVSIFTMDEASGALTIAGKSRFRAGLRYWRSVPTGRRCTPGTVRFLRSPATASTSRPVS